MRVNFVRNYYNTPPCTRVTTGVLFSTKEISDSERDIWAHLMVILITIEKKILCLFRSCLRTVFACSGTTRKV